MVFKYNMNELEECFYQVSDRDDWRAPIDAWIPEEDYSITLYAVAHHTATPLVIVDRNTTGLVRVVADGYRNGLAGPNERLN